MQKILTFIIGVAILYMVFKQNFNNIQTPVINPTNAHDTEKKRASSEPEITGNIVEKTISEVFINVLKTEEGKKFFENLVQPVNSTISGSDQSFKLSSANILTSMFNIKTTGQGGLGPVSCGHIATVKFTLFGKNNIILNEGVTTYPLGSNKIAEFVDPVIVGMHIGQTRTATINANSGEKFDKLPSSPTMFRASLTLQGITPPNIVQGAKIFDDEFAYIKPLLCGQKVVYNAKITKLSNNQVIFDSSTTNKISMKIGDLAYPVIFSHALHSKIPVGTRTVIAKGKFFKSYLNNYSAILPKTALPEDEFFLLELSDFEK